MMFSLENHTGFMGFCFVFNHKSDLKLITSHSPLCGDLGSLTPWAEVCLQREAL